MNAAANADHNVLEIRALIERQMAEERASIAERARIAQQPPKLPDSVQGLIAIDSDEWFVKYAYLTILGRHADLPGLHGNLDALRQGRITRDAILITMSRSPERKSDSPQLHGLGAYVRRARRRASLVKRLPWLVSAMDFVRNLTRLNQLTRHVEQGLNQQDHKLALLDQRIQAVMDFSSSLKGQFDRRAANIAQPAPPTAHLPEHGPKEQPGEDLSLNAFINDFFKELSERFRGSEADILQRNRIYSDILRSVGSANSDAPILDIACGRGEMLHVVNDLGLQAIGIDLNDDQIAYCRSKSLEVYKSDALGFIKSRGTASLAAITTTHFVEHLEFDYLVQTLRESFRALRPGGGIIIETPNPLNLVVSTVQFYMDPSHRNPIPMNLMQLLLEKIGFEVTPIDLSARGLDASMGSVEHPQLNCLLNSPQDYALLGIKPR